MNKSQRQIRETKQKAALRQRLIDMARGAGLEHVEDEDFWVYSASDLCRLMHSVNVSFVNQLDEVYRHCVTGHMHLDKYECLNDLQEFLWSLGVRA